MSEAERLLPCPFCGGEAEVERVGDYRQSHIIACTECGCRLETGEDAEWNRGNAWNTRAQSARIAALEEALRGIEEGTIERPVGSSYREDGKPSKHDRCIHDVWMYEACEGCIDAHITKALGKGSE